MADTEPDRQALLTALTTEHFTLQGARSQTVSGSASRASLYVFSVSSTLVALGFIGQLSDVGDTFEASLLRAGAAGHEVLFPSAPPGGGESLPAPR